MANDSDAIGSVIERAAASAEAAGNRPATAWSADQVRQLNELHEAVAELRNSVARMAPPNTISASDALDGAIVEVEDTLKRNVFASVGIAAFLGYVWGRFR